MLDVNEHFSFQLPQPRRLGEHRGIKGMWMLERRELPQGDRQGEGAVLSMAREANREQAGKLL